MKKMMIDLTVIKATKTILISIFGEDELDRAIALLKPEVYEFIQSEIAIKIDPLYENYQNADQEQYSNEIARKLNDIRNQMDTAAAKIGSAASKMQFS